MAGRKHTQEQVESRRQEVEAALASGQWSRQVAQALASRWAVSLRQVFRDRATVLDGWKKEHSTADTSLERARVLEEMRGVRARCVQMGLRDQGGDSRLVAQAVNLFRLEVEVLGLADPAGGGGRSTGRPDADGPGGGGRAAYAGLTVGHEAEATNRGSIRGNGGRRWASRMN